MIPEADFTAADVRIRRFQTETDLDVLYQMAAAQTFPEFCLWGADWVYDYPPSREQMLGRIHSLDRTELYTVYCEQQIIGFAELADMNPAERTAVLSRFVICPAFRNAGMGTKALQMILKEGKQALGLQSISLIVYEKNGIARSVYRKVGFTETEKLIRQGRPDAYRMICIL